MLFKRLVRTDALPKLKILGLAVLAACCFRECYALQFTNVTTAAGISHVQGPPSDPLSTPEAVGMTGGAAAGDYNGDGLVDLFVTRTDAPDILYRNNGDGTFADATTAAFGPTPLNLPTNGAAWGDIDNDGDLDLYVTTVGAERHLLYTNHNGVFTEAAVARGAAIGGPGLTVYGTGIAFGDYDADGYLDSFVTEWRPATMTSPIRAALLHNLGAASPGHFEDRTIAEGVSIEAAQTGRENLSLSFAPRFTDLDGDRRVDLAITSDFGTSRLFWNEGPSAGPRFSDGTLAAGVETGRNDMGSTVGDVNGDGLLDWFITDIFFDGATAAHPNGNRLFLNNGDRTFTDGTNAAGVRNGDWGWGTALADFDNDGDLDLTMTNGFIDGAQFLNDPMRLWENDGAGVFTDVSTTSGVDDTGQGRGLLTFDYDDDGDLDVFVVNHGQAPVLLRNDTINTNSFLRITTQGTESNRDGVGARILVTPDASQPDETMIREIDAGSHFLAMSEMTAHFGLGSHTGTIDEVLILWPSGYNQRLVDVPLNAEITVTETPGDFNGDGLVDAADFTIWRESEGLSGDFLHADSDGDGDVDADDLNRWSQSLGREAFTVVLNNGVSIPEPSAFALILLDALIFFGGLTVRRPALTSHGQGR